MPPHFNPSLPPPPPHESSTPLHSSRFDQYEPIFLSMGFPASAGTCNPYLHLNTNEYPTTNSKSRREREHRGSRRVQPHQGLVHRNIKPKNCGPYDFSRERGQKVHPQLSTGFDEMFLRPSSGDKQLASEICSGLDTNQKAKSLSTQGHQVSLNPPLDFPMNRATCFVVRKTRGANNPNFNRNFRELIRHHNPCMVALLETKMDNYHSIKNDFGFDEFLEVPATGRSGGSCFF